MDNNEKEAFASTYIHAERISVDNAKTTSFTEP